MRCGGRGAAAPQAVTGPADQTVQPVGGVQQDEDDGGAVQVAGGLGGADGALRGAGRGDQRELVGVAGHQQRQRGDEDGAGGGAGDRAEAADDDHGEVVDGQHKSEVVGHHPAEGERQQHPGEARVHRRHHERGGAVPGHVDAHHGGGGLAVAEGGQRPAGSGAEQTAGGEPGEREQRQAQEPQPLLRAERHTEDVQFAVRVEGEPADGERGHGAAVEAAGDRLGGEQDVVAEEDQGEGGDAQVDALDPAGDGTEQPAGQARHQHREGHGEGGRQARSRVAGQPGVAVRADGEEEGVAEGELSRGAAEQGETDGADRGRHGEQADAQPERVEVERRQAQHHGDDEQGGAAAGEERGDPVRHGPLPSRRTARWAAPGAPAASRRTGRPRRTRPPARAVRTGSRRRAPRSAR